GWRFWKGDLPSAVSIDFPGLILRSQCLRVVHSASMNLTLEPVDSLTITTLVDNYFDMLLTDQGAAKRVGLPTTETPRVAAAAVEEGETPDTPLAEHGFSAMITLTSNEREHRVLFDTGMSPDGLVENMRRLGHSPKDLAVA